MFDIVYEFFGIAGLAAPQNMAELIPYLLRYVTAVAIVLAVFKMIGYIAGFFFNWRWFR